MHLRTAGSECFKHRAWPYENGPGVNRNDLEDLEELKLIRIERTNSSWRVAPSQQGIVLAESYEHAEAWE